MHTGKGNTVEAYLIIVLAFLSLIVGGVLVNVHLNSHLYSRAAKKELSGRRQPLGAALFEQEGSVEGYGLDNGLYDAVFSPSHGEMNEYIRKSIMLLFIGLVVVVLLIWFLISII